MGLDPENSNIQFGFGRAARAMGRLDIAKAAYERALALNPNHPLARQRLSDVLNLLSRSAVDYGDGVGITWGLR
ncbi:tetratricopeptide repeat protein [Roseiarcus sp.]|uniref:tetratricopeptide repeat protein n=1 Tax=Roseiarcus sp. TaxID=1969460 RepID=UPI003C73D3AE